MSVTTTMEQDLKEKLQVVDDLDLDQPETNPEPQEEVVAAAALKLQQLKEKMKASSMPIKIVEEKKKTFKLGVIGTGQCGSRLAESMHQLGYPAVCFNTAPQDLVDIKIPESHKYHLENGVAGASKELSIGHAAAQNHKDSILEMVAEKLGDCEIFILALSLGGGSGAGSCDTMLEVLGTFGKPIVVITVLPMNSDDSQTKKNSLETLSKLTKELQAKKIHNIVVVDNAKIENIYRHVPQIDFFDITNKAIVEPLDVFNTLSSMKSPVKPLDGAEWLKLLVDGEGLSVYGETIIDNYQEDFAIAEAIVNSTSNVLAEGFDLKQAKYVGFMISAPKRVHEQIAAANINYANSMIDDICSAPNGIFKGTYVVEGPDDVVKIYSFFSGLALPQSRVEQLRKEASAYAEKMKNKDAGRNLNLKMDTGTDPTISMAEKIKQQISAKKSAFGNFVFGGSQDRRK